MIENKGTCGTRVTVIDFYLEAVRWYTELYSARQFIFRAYNSLIFLKNGLNQSHAMFYKNQMIQEL